MNNYKNFISRNTGYITQQTQDKIKSSTILIAGCGIGSQLAEAAARTGFEKFILVDGDTIDIHNLNRQFFFHHQIGQFKSDALKANILAINPSCQIQSIKQNISTINAKELVSESDIIFDTIDFLDLSGIVALHDEAHSQNKIVISSFSVGFGAAVISLPPSQQPHAPIRDFFSLPKTGSIDNISYVERFKKLFTAMSSKLEPDVLNVMTKVFQEIADGKTCPAPQVSVGAHAVSAVALTSAIRILSGQPITTANMIVLNLPEILQEKGFDLNGGKT